MFVFAVLVTGAVISATSICCKSVPCTVTAGNEGCSFDCLQWL